MDKENTGMDKEQQEGTDEEMEVTVPPVEEEIKEGTEGDPEREGSSKFFCPPASPPNPPPTLTISRCSTTQHDVKRTRLPPLTLNSPGEKMEKEEEKGACKRKKEESSGKYGRFPPSMLVPSHNQIFIRYAPLPHSPTSSHARCNAYSSSGDEGILNSSEDEGNEVDGTTVNQTPRIRRSSKRQKSECGKHIINVPLTGPTCECKPRLPVDCMNVWASEGRFNTSIADNFPAISGNFRGKIISHSNAPKHFAVKSKTRTPMFTLITMTTARAQLIERALYPIPCPAETNVDEDCERLFLEAENELRNELTQPAAPPLSPPRARARGSTERGAWRPSVAGIGPAIFGKGTIRKIRKRCGRSMTRWIPPGKRPLNRPCRMVRERRKRLGPKRQQPLLRPANRPPSNAAKFIAADAWWPGGEWTGPCPRSTVGRYCRPWQPA